MKKLDIRSNKPVEPKAPDQRAAIEQALGGKLPFRQGSTVAQTPSGEFIPVHAATHTATLPVAVPESTPDVKGILSGYTPIEATISETTKPTPSEVKANKSRMVNEALESIRRAKEAKLNPPPKEEQAVKPKPVKQPEMPREDELEFMNYFTKQHEAEQGTGKDTGDAEKTSDNSTVYPDIQSDKPMSAGGVKPDDNCQHCGWSRSRPDPEEPSTFDKSVFVQSVLGQIPFRKSYELLNGKVVVEFRTLNNDEADLAFLQVAFDANAGVVLSEHDYVRTLIDYRLCLGLASLRLGAETINLPDHIKEWDTDEVVEKETKIKKITPYIYNTVLKTEPVRRAVAACFYRFQRFVERMEAHFDDPNFWQVIEEQA